VPRELPRSAARSRSRCGGARSPRAW
jgi:hypothetical protein